MSQIARQMALISMLMALRDKRLKKLPAYLYHFDALETFDPCACKINALVVASSQLDAIKAVDAVVNSDPEVQKNSNSMSVPFIKGLADYALESITCTLLSNESLLFHGQAIILYLNIEVINEL